MIKEASLRCFFQVVDKIDKMGDWRQRPRARKNKVPGRAVYIECTAPGKTDIEKNPPNVG